MKLGWLQIVILLLIGFALGWGFTTWQCERCGGHYHKKFAHKERITEKLSKKLALSEEQREKVQVAIERKHEQMKKVMNQTRDEIKSILNEEQAKKFDELVSKCKGFN